MNAKISDLIIRLMAIRRESGDLPLYSSSRGIPITLDDLAKKKADSLKTNYFEIYPLRLELFLNIDD